MDTMQGDDMSKKYYKEFIEYTKIHADPECTICDGKGFRHLPSTPLKPSGELVLCPRCYKPDGHPRKRVDRELI